MDPLVVISTIGVLVRLLKRGWPLWRAYALVAGIFIPYAWVVLRLMGFTLSSYMVIAPCAFLHAGTHVREQCGPISILEDACLICWIIPVFAMFVWDAMRRRTRT